MQFILLATLLLMVVAQALLLVQDSFPFYPFGAPVEKEDEWTKEELEDAGNGHPTTPDEECPAGDRILSDEELITLYARGLHDDSLLRGVRNCGSFAVDLVRILDAAATVITITATVIWGIEIILGCLSGLAMGGIGLAAGCLAGFASGMVRTAVLLMVADAVGLLSAAITCIRTGSLKWDKFITTECSKAAALAGLGLAVAVPIADAIIDYIALSCLDFDEGIRPRQCEHFHRMWSADD